MASKKFAYYGKGNKIALIQKNNNEAYCSLSGYENKTDCENAGGTWYSAGSFAGDSSTYGKYKSPNSTIEKGLEVEYTYAPVYNLQSTGTEGTDLHKFLGWGSDGTNLLFFTYGATDVQDLASTFAADDWIYVAGSGRWSGLHQIHTDSSALEPHGAIKTTTKCNINPSELQFAGTFSNANGTIEGHDTTDDKDINEFGKLVAHYSQSYIFIRNAENTANNGFFSAAFDTDSGKITLDNKYTISAIGAYTSANEAVVDRTEDTIRIYNVFYEEITVYENISVMQDETFELDLTRYQANAVILYMRAKLAEEMGNIELFEYYNVKFTKQLEKASGSRKYGPHIVQGHGMTRK